MNQPKHLEDLHEGRGWLNRAAEMLDSCEDHVSDAEFARAAAAIGDGFIQLAAVQLQAEMGAGAAEHNQRILEMQSVIADAHRALEGRVRAEKAEIEARTAKLAELDAATLAASGLRERRAAAEARPHDDEARSCAFVHDGQRCTFRPGHHMLWHRLEDGTEVNDQGEPMGEEADRG